MSRLKSYQEKRKFEQTTEPKPKLGKTKPGLLRFSVQKHQARRLHYDLRLELDGVLLSWAVPKGPSMDPKDKRLAIHVEDHPLDYIYFEGVIPPGNYGAGTVEVWDKGLYVAEPKAMRDGLKKGHLHFELQGKKLKGTFTLIKIKSEKDNAWLLFKVEDEEAKKKAPLKKTKMPEWVSPMLASVADKAFDSDEWLFEIKWDGYRALAFLNKSNVELMSRNQKSFNAQFPTLVDELKHLKAKAILDGEIVAVDDEGHAHFELLQGWADNSGNLHYMIFDLLFLDGYDLRSLPLTERKERLHQFLSPFQSQFLHFSDHAEDKGMRLFEEAKKNGLEGLIGKRKNSPYVSMRSQNWRKIKTSRGQEFVIGGFTKTRNSREHFRSLILGTYEDGVLKFAGHVGTGFDQQSLEAVFKKMKPLIRKTCPFEVPPKTNGPATWLKPQLVAEIGFAEITKQGILRQPVFRGLRQDKLAKEITKESPASGISSSLFSNIGKIYWPKEGFTKGDMLAYYEAVAPFMVPHLEDRALTLRRFPDGIDGLTFYQKNITKPPSWLTTVLLDHPHGKGKKQDLHPVINDAQSLLYCANLGSIEIHPMLARSHNLEFPDFLVIDLDPEDIPFHKVIEVAKAAHRLFDAIELPSYCKTSGWRGLHLYVPLGGQVFHEESLRLAELLAYVLREQLPSLVSLERMPKRRQKRVYIDFLQNVKGKSMVAPYSLRARPGAPVSTPLKWSEVKEGLEPLDFNMLSVPKRLIKIGDIFAPVLEGAIDLEEVLKRLERHL
jgi:bifunctional non-homologous end joining protein LigD